MPEGNKHKVILHLCASEHGSDSKPYRDAGYDVRLITKEVDVRTYVPPKNVYGIIANPPCTKFSLANPREGFRERDFAEALELVDACLRITRICVLDGLTFWVLENPRGYLARFLGRPHFTYQPWQFGDESFMATKRTWLWGYFNPPQPSVERRTIPYIKDGSRERSKNRLFPVENRNKQFSNIGSDERSIASPYFTQAFFKANP